MIGLAILLLLLWLGAVIFLYHYRIWLVYYLAGVIGLAYALVWLARVVFHIEPALAYSTAWTVHTITGYLDIPTRIFERAPDVLLVLVVVQRVGETLGWTMLKIGVESSGLLEICVLISLIWFYPGWTFYRRLGSIVFGLAASWFANVLRLLLIVVLLHTFGKNALVLAHTYAGKLFFFLLTIGLYWVLVTLPVVRDLSASQTASS
ncbi:MAG: exosortase family protein XrtG [Anaerolineales bacterium]